MPCSRNQFKILAILFMVADHIGAFFLGNNVLLRCIGRLAFPMFVFLLADGYNRTRNVKKYLVRLGILYVLSIVPYSLACSGTLSYPVQNVYASLFLYLLLFCVLGCDKIPKAAKCGAVILTFLLAYSLRLEYSWYGAAAAVILFYVKTLGISNASLLFAALSLFYGRQNRFPIQIFAALSLFLIPYQGEFMETERPGKGLSIATYLFYPVHLLFIGIINL